MKMTPSIPRLKRQIIAVCRDQCMMSLPRYRIIPHYPNASNGVPAGLVMAADETNREEFTETLIQRVQMEAVNVIAAQSELILADLERNTISETETNRILCALKSIDPAAVVERLRQRKLAWARCRYFLFVLLVTPAFLGFIWLFITMILGPF